MLPSQMLPLCCQVAARVAHLDIPVLVHQLRRREGEVRRDARGRHVGCTDVCAHAQTSCLKCRCPPHTSNGRQPSLPPPPHQAVLRSGDAKQGPQPCCSSAPPPHCLSSLPYISLSQQTAAVPHQVSTFQVPVNDHRCVVMQIVHAERSAHQLHSRAGKEARGKPPTFHEQPTHAGSACTALSASYGLVQPRPPP